jgi:hypothetical protein
MPSGTVHDIKTLISSFHPLVVLETSEEDRVHTILDTAAWELGMVLFEWSVTRGLRRRDSETQFPSKISGGESPLGMLKHIETLTVDAIYLIKDFGAYLEDPAVARQLREVSQSFTRTRSAMVLSGRSVVLPRDLQHLAAYYKLELPEQNELLEVFHTTVKSLRATHQIRIELDPQEEEEFVSALRGLTLNEARQTIAHAAITDGKLNASDVRHVQDRKAQILRDGGLLEYFPAADNPFQLAGFERLKQWLARARMGFSPEAAQLNLTPPKGILLVGVQGCGKSLTAKVVAREWRLPLLKLDAGSLFDKYLGESEKNLRKAISQAEGMAPAVLWIDEIEKGMAPGGGSGEGDGGVSRRMFGTFLTWLQEKRADVFVVATANDLQALPPELLRKGRFDEIFFVDLPDPSEREGILRIHLRLRKQDPDAFDLAALVAASEGFSGAEIEQATIAGLYRALHDRKPLTTELLLAEMRETVPLSVSRREDVARLRALARERFVPVS